MENFLDNESIVTFSNKTCGICVLSLLVTIVLTFIILDKTKFVIQFIGVLYKRISNNTLHVFEKNGTVEMMQDVVTYTILYLSLHKHSVNLS